MKTPEIGFGDTDDYQDGKKWLVHPSRLAVGGIYTLRVLLPPELVADETKAALKMRTRIDAVKRFADDLYVVRQQVEIPHQDGFLQGTGGHFFKGNFLVSRFFPEGYLKHDFTDMDQELNSWVEGATAPVDPARVPVGGTA